MASVEAKAKWLRFANHCIVDEDYKRASRPPKFTPSSSKSESEETVVSCDLPADTKWWLYQQHKVNAGSFWNPQPACVENCEDASIQELEAVIGDTLQKQPTHSEAWTEDDHLVDFDPYECINSDERSKLFSELESRWIGMKKNEPWWHTADMDDFASFVSHKSLEHFDNCDLPLPQTNKTEWLVCDTGLASLDQEPEKEKSSFSNSVPRSLNSMCMGETKYTSGVVRCSPCGIDMPLSTMQSDEKNLETPSGELRNAQLLEALYHSERRAREAEKAAKQACNEKEHVITLFLRQANHIFAYKQWLHILQLETLCLQLRHNRYHQTYTSFPDFLVPWFPTKGEPPKRVHEDTKRKLGSQRYKIYESVGEFLLGLALVGAGVLLGWTLGWLFPTL